MNFLHYKVVLLNSARKNLQKIPHQERLKILKKLDLLIGEQVSLNIKKLRSFQDLYRIRSGDYRIIYKNDSKKQIFLIAIICHRKEVYKYHLDSLTSLLLN
ncbi:MAG: type II toxin-antitoxin system RelE/ParE family toxin [bacterium]